MTTRLVHRPARLSKPRPVVDPRPVEAPPVLPESKGLGGMHALLPMMGMGGSMSMMLVFRGSGLAGIGALVMVLVVVATGAMFFTQRGQATRTRRQQRERYLDYLEELREELSDHEKQTLTQARELDPPPAALLDVVRDPSRLWERRRRDLDFLALRAGTGPLPAQPLDLQDKGSPLQPTDPFMMAEAQALVRRYGTVVGLPLRVPLDLAGDVSIVGDRASVLTVVRALLTQAAALHAPEDVGMAVAYPPNRETDWDWVRWLPHLADQEQHDAGGPVRRVAADPTALAHLMGTELNARANQAAEARRNLSGNALAPTLQRLLVVHDTYGETAVGLPIPDRAATPRRARHHRPAPGFGPIVRAERGVAADHRRGRPAAGRGPSPGLHVRRRPGRRAGRAGRRPRPAARAAAALPRVVRRRHRLGAGGLSRAAGHRGPAVAAPRQPVEAAWRPGLPARTAGRGRHRPARPAGP
ncbi:hypothetical protein [Fodinicola feengrottensis]|uniref:hypothetical protein n=1 Tax=Fodinicola feengrottensis TaxID=435914 RepID=UPI002443715A|nr:hypothetical protein [Fodinicola feengrottensis]